MSFRDDDSWTAWFMSMTRLTAGGSSCLRRHVGCVITRPDGFVVSCGYNHIPRPAEACGVCRRENYASGDRLDLCHAVHAEMDAIAHAARRGLSVEGCTAYVSVFPCVTCAGVLIESGIDRVIVGDGYAGAADSAELFRRAGYEVIPHDTGEYSFGIVRRN